MPEKKKTEKWVNLDVVFPSACTNCLLRDEDKTEFGTDRLIDECFDCLDRKAYLNMSQGIGHVHDATMETFTYHQISIEAMGWLQ